MEQDFVPTINVKESFECGLENAESSDADLFNVQTRRYASATIKRADDHSCYKRSFLSTEKSTSHGAKLARFPKPRAAKPHPNPKALRGKC